MTMTDRHRGERDRQTDKELRSDRYIHTNERSVHIIQQDARQSHRRNTCHDSCSQTQTSTQRNSRRRRASTSHQDKRQRAGVS